MGQAKPIRRRKPGPVGTGKTAFVGLRLEPKLTAKLDAWAHRNAVSRSEALRRLAEKALTCPTLKMGTPATHELIMRQHA
jgi:Ribbon-helix-helix protein, copG family